MTERAFNSGVRRFVSSGVVAVAAVWFAAGFLACLNIFALRHRYRCGDGATEAHRSHTPGSAGSTPAPASQLRIAECGLQIEEKHCKTDQSAIRNPQSKINKSFTGAGPPHGPTSGRGGSLPPFPAPANHLFEAIRRVESGGNDRAVGDGGRSRGPYQIGKAYWQDACEFGGVVLDYETLVWSRPHCERVMRWYWRRYGAETDCERAILHNAGPRGLAYWRRVVHELHELHEAKQQAAQR